MQAAVFANCYDCSIAQLSNDQLFWRSNQAGQCRCKRADWLILFLRQLLQGGAGALEGVPNELLPLAAFAGRSFSRRVRSQSSEAWTAACAPSSAWTAEPAPSARATSRMPPGRQWYFSASWQGRPSFWWDRPWTAAPMTCQSASIAIPASWMCQRIPIQRAAEASARRDGNERWQRGSWIAT